MKFRAGIGIGFLLIVAAWFSAGSAWAASAKLTSDINAVPPTWRAATFDYARLGNYVYFLANQNHWGDESDGWREEYFGYGLWRTDGTQAGTVLIRRFDESPCGLHGTVCEMVTASGRLWIVSDSRLWVSDGTNAGTQLLRTFDAIDIPTGDEYRCLRSAQLTATDSGVMFLAATKANGIELWTSDGTGAGTRMLVDLHSGDETTWVESDHGWGDWHCYADIYRFVVLGNKTVVAAIDGIWVTDGTSAGTSKLLTVDLEYVDYYYDDPRNGALVKKSDGRVYFGLPQWEATAPLWQTDGTLAGTKPVTSTNLYSVDQLTRVGDDVFLRACRGADYNCTSALAKVDAAGNGIQYLAPTRVVPSELVAMSGELRFWGTGNDGVVGLWKSDGNDAGTRFVAVTPQPIPSNELRRVARDGQRLYFFGTASGTSSYALDLWMSDGTSAGTQTVKRFTAAAGADELWAGNLTSLSGVILFNTDGDLWRTDGTPEATRRLSAVPLTTGSSDPEFLTDVNGTLYFTANDGVHGRELWRRDAGAAPRLVRDIEPGAAGTDLRELVNVNGRLYFMACTTAQGCEVWTSDGTAAGTRAVSNFAPNEGGPSTSFGVLGNAWYFSASDATHGMELWRTNPSGVGVTLVKDINPGSGDSMDCYYCSVQGALLGDRLVFSAYDAARGHELWITDGTAVGTVMLKDIRRGVGGSGPSNFASVGDRVFFSAYDKDTGVELWVSDGTTAGTHLVTDLVPGSSGARPRLLTNLNGIVYFAIGPSDQPLYRWPLSFLWRSDGTANGTYAVRDLANGDVDRYSYINSIRIVGDGLIASLWRSETTGLWRSYGNALWRSFGSYGTTFPVTPEIPADGTSYSIVGAINGAVYYTETMQRLGVPPGNAKLWRLNAGSADARVVATVPHLGGCSYDSLKTGVSHGTAYLIGADKRGCELWSYTP